MIDVLLYALTIGLSAYVGWVSASSPIYLSPMAGAAFLGFATVMIWSRRKVTKEALLTSIVFYWLTLIAMVVARERVLHRLPQGEMLILCLFVTICFWVSLSFTLYLKVQRDNIPNPYPKRK